MALRFLKKNLGHKAEKKKKEKKGPADKKKTYLVVKGIPFKEMRKDSQVF